MQTSSLTAFETTQKIQTRKLRACEAAEACLATIARTEPQVGAYLHITQDMALAQAKAVDEALSKGRAPGPLAGVPVAVKDNILVEGVTATAGSRIIENFEAPYDATAVARLKAAGAVIVGKTNLDEFAMGSSCEYSSFKPTRNPWNTDFVPGGSSGGSAAAVAAGSAAVALGSDTGGSVRQPAAFCGVAGLKPTYGTVSRYGLIAFASSLDQIGVLGQDTRDIALVMSVISGHDEKDSTSLRPPTPDFLGGLDEGMAGMTLGVAQEYVSLIENRDVRAAFESAVETYRGLGAQIREVSLPHADSAVAAYYILAPAEASSNLARYTGIHYSRRRGEGGLAREVIEGTRMLFGPEVKRRIMLGTFVLSSGYYDAYYLKARKTRALVQRDFENAFETCDAILMPTTPTPAFRLGEKLDDPLQMYLCDVMTVAVNLAGVPGLSIPCGTSGEGLPVGLQIVGPGRADADILRIGRAFERETGFFNRIAPLGNGGVK
jgi:aspartyl-tRNA(Asn)/glutamyl-tRNA(Gln) amidotransferase subunit A